MKTNIKPVVIKLTVILSVVIILCSIAIKALGTENPNFDINQFEEERDQTQVHTLVNNTASTVVAVLRIASIAISIVILLVIAMKYMVSSAGDRADIKKHAVAYVVGTFILFSAMQIIAILVDISNKAFST